MKYLSFGFVAVIVAGIAALAVSITPPPSPSDVAGVWMGSAKERRLIRVEFDTNGTGYVCISFPHDAAPYLYRIDSWQLADFMIRVRAQPVGDDIPRVTFGPFRYSRGALVAEIDKEKIELWSEQEWQARVARIQEHIAAYRKAH